jgi:hypothetical protein
MRKLRQDGSSSFEPEAEARGVGRSLSREPVREASTNSVGGRKIRCAIYTRKSSEEGLEQEFNSLDAQREACEAFIKSQRHEGWSVLPHLYDDGGYSGGTVERPALKRLLAEETERPLRETARSKAEWEAWLQEQLQDDLRRRARHREEGYDRDDDGGRERERER